MLRDWLDCWFLTTWEQSVIAGETSATWILHSAAFASSRGAPVHTNTRDFPCDDEADFCAVRPLILNFKRLAIG